MVIRLLNAYQVSKKSKKPHFSSKTVNLNRINVVAASKNRDIEPKTSILIQSSGKQIFPSVDGG